MKKILLFALSVLFVIAVAIGNISVMPTSELIAATPYESITRTATINNTNSTDSLAYTLPSSALFTYGAGNRTIGFTYNISSPVLIESMGSRDISYAFTVPSGMLNGTYAGTLNFTTNNSESAALNIVLGILDTVGLNPLTEPLTASQSQQLTRTIIISNTHPTNSLTFTLPSSIIFYGSRENKTVSMSYNTSSPVAVSPGADKPINYSFTMPSNMFNSTYTSRLNITANNSDYETLDIELGVLGADNATVNNSASTGVKGLTHNSTVLAANTGNTDLAGISFAITNLVNTANSSNTFPSTSITLPTSFNLNYGQSAVKGIQYSVPTTQREGAYAGNLTMAYGGNTAVSTVTLTIEAARYALGFSESPFSFGEIVVNSTKSKAVTITNTGNDALTNVRLVNLSVPLKYNLTINDTSPAALQPGKSKSYMLSAYMPVSESSGMISLGSIQALSDQINSTLSLSADVKGRLMIKDVEVKVADETDTNVNNGETISKKAKPGDEVRFTMTVENKYTREQDVDMENVIVTVTIEGIDDGDDLEEESEEFDIEPEKDDDIDLTFTVPEDADEDTFDVIIKAEGEDSNGNEQSHEMTVKLTVERDRHKIVVYKAELDSNVMTCKKTNALRVTAKNIGSTDEDNTVLTIKSTELKIDTKDSIELSENPDDDDNEYSKTVNFQLPDGLALGDYPIEIRLYYNDDKLVDVETAVLKVAACTTAAAVAEEEEGESVVVVTPPATPATTPVTTPTTPTITVPPTIVTDLGAGYKDSTLYMALLITANIAVVLLVVVLFAQLLRPRGPAV